MDTQIIHNFSNCYCELKGFSNCFAAYAENFSGEDVIEGGIGFNSSSGCTYIALENGITICSAFGGSVEYLVTDMETGEEFFFDSTEEALEKFEQLNK